MNIDFEDWLMMMNTMLELGKEKGYVLYDMKAWDYDEEYKTIDRFVKSDVFEDAGWYSLRCIKGSND